MSSSSVTLVDPPARSEADVAIAVVEEKADAGLAIESAARLYRLDFLVEKTVVLELKSVETLQKIHQAQLLTYLKIGGWPIGLLINFNVPVLRNGIKRMVHNLK